MKVAIMFLGWVIGIINSKQQLQCKTLNLQPNTTYYSNHINAFLFEGDEDDYQGIYHIDQEIVQQSFIIPYQEKPIKIVIINPLEEAKLFEKLICQLYFNQKYIISCISVESIYFGEKNSLNEKIQIITNIDSLEICDEMYDQEDQGFLITCLANSTLKQYSVSFNGSVILVFQYDVFNQIQDRCQKQQKLLPDFTFIFMYYQCSSWKVFSYYDHNIIILIEPNQFETIQFIQDIQFCLYNQQYCFYLIEEHKYHHLIIDSSGQINHIYSIVRERLIMKLIMMQTCSQIILITKYQETDRYFEQLLLQEISFPQAYLANNIHFYSNILFLQNNTELILIPNVHFNQTYEIVNTQIIFLQSYNLFYQIDQSNQFIQFYRYSKIHNYIKPKLKYLFIMKFNNFATLTLTECFKIQYQIVEEKKINKYKIHFSIPCKLDSFPQSMIYQSKSIKKNSIQLFNEGTNTNVNIWNDEKFNNSCFDKLNMKKFKGNIQLRSIKKYDLIIFDDNLYIYFFDCQQDKILLKTFTNNSQVFEYNDKYYIYEMQRSVIKIVQVMERAINFHQLKIDGKILQIQQFYNIMIFSVTNKRLPSLLNMDLIQFDYISKNLFEPEDILFYKEIGQAKFIQYKYLLALELPGTVKYFEFTGVTIVEIIQYLKGDYQILAIQNITNSFFYYYFDQFDLLLVSNYTLSNYSISYPIKYISSFQQLIVLLESINSNYIVIFYLINNKIVLDEIIQTGDSFFIYFDNCLIYHDTNQELRQKHFKTIFIEIKSQSVYNNEFFLFYQFSVNSINLDEPSDFKLLIQNNCTNLQTYSNNTQILMKQGDNLRLKISEYFHGPLDSLRIRNGSQTNLKGPIQLNQKIFNCSSQDSQYCFKEYRLLNQKDKTVSYKFKALFFDNVIILDQARYDPQKLYIVIFWLKDTSYVLLKQQLEKLELSLAILEKQVLIEKSNLIINFPTSFKNIEIKKTGNVIQIEHHQTYFLISNLTINQIYLPDQVLDISQIENETDRYIVVKGSSELDCNIELVIYRIINFKDIKILYTQQLNILFNQIIIQYFSQFQHIKIRQCSQSVNIIFLNLLIVCQQYSFLTYFEINIKDHGIEKFEVVQYIRNQGVYENMNYNFLVQKQLNPVAYLFYDLREDQKYKDYIFRTTQQIQIYVLNTTHNVYITQSEYYLGTFGYEIEVRNPDHIIQNLILEAQNQVSSVELYMQITVDENNSNFRSNSIFIIQILNLSFIGAYISRYKKKKITIKQIDRLEHF